ncbi:hypothetical protein TRVL_04816 [Trypanosoma vivax]|nr:hypothetical protein TRVL_04816 [Trypanosoma vivax]
MIPVSGTGGHGFNSRSGPFRRHAFWDPTGNTTVASAPFPLSPSGLSRSKSRRAFFHDKRGSDTAEQTAKTRVAWKKKDGSTMAHFYHPSLGPAGRPHSVSESTPAKRRLKGLLRQTRSSACSVQSLISTRPDSSSSGTELCANKPDHAQVAMLSRS